MFWSISITLLLILDNPVVSSSFIIITIAYLCSYCWRCADAYSLEVISVFYHSCSWNGLELPYCEEHTAEEFWEGPDRALKITT